jgi:hypothetical protein
MARLTRRAFLELAAEQSLTASLAATALLAACRSTADRSSALGLDSRSMRTLITLIDEIIPASGEMPGASQAGTLAYFELLAGTDPSLSQTLHAALRSANALAQARFGKELTSIPSTSRTTIVAALAQSEVSVFAGFRTYVYEGYYLQPEIWKLLGYEPYPTTSQGPSMAPFSPSMLERIRAMPRRYRAV